MARDYERLREAIEEELEPVIADEGVILRIMHACETNEWSPVRFPYRLISVITACAAVLLFVSVLMFMDGMKQSQFIGGSLFASNGEYGGNAAEPVAKAGDEGEPQNASYTVTVNLVPLQSDNGLFGYVDATGAYVIAPLYTEANMFEGDRAKVLLNGEYVYIDVNGDIIGK